MRSRHPAIIAALAVASVAALGAGSRAQTERTRSIFVSMVDGTGRPITDLQANEIAVAEDGQKLEIVGFRTATSPLSIALLADTTGVAEPFIRDIRNTLEGFVRRIQKDLPESEIMVMEFGQAAVPLTKFSKNTADLAKTIKRVYPKRQTQSVLMEAIGESSKMLGTRTNARRAIVILNVDPSIDQSALRPNQVLDEVRKSGTSVWAVSFAVQQGNSSAGVVLPVLTQNTGGYREMINSPSAMEPRMQQVADALLAQYEVTYVRPSYAEPPKLLQVRVSRPGLTIRAPVWPAR